jgi:DNA-binding transcriptional MerR regulator
MGITAGVAPVALDDPTRVEEIRRVATTRAGDQEIFDRLTTLVTSLLDVPVSLISVVEPDRQLFASCVGLEAPWSETRETPLSHSFCQHAVLSQKPLVIEDARSHPLVRDNLAIRDLKVVAYLGIPLTTSSGHTIGSFCAIDSKPRAWSERDLRVLADLAATVMAYMEARASAASSAADAGLNIAAVSRRTGIAADTLRKWERRYAILRPKRTSGGQRRYDDADIARVEWLRDRLDEGYRIGEAAALLEGMDVGAAGSPTELCEKLVDAARAADAARVVSLVEQAFIVHPVAVAVEEVAAPALRTVGDAWAEHVRVVGHEHLLSQVVRSRLQRMLADRRAGVRGTLVLACAPGELHDIGLLALAVLLQADGWLVAYVGADAPLEASMSVAEQLDADLLCLSATLPEHGAALATALDELPTALNARVVLGGPAAPGHGRATAVLPPETPLAEVVARLRSA